MRELKTLSAALLAIAIAPGIARAGEVQVIVGFHGKADPAILARHGGGLDTDLSGCRAAAGHVPAARLAALRAEPGVAYVEEDQVCQPSLAPNDPYFTSYQTGAFMLSNFPAAWGVSTGAGVRVCVLDTGCQTAHPDITGKVKASKNFSNGKSTDVTDRDGHGTHTAGTVGAQTNNGKGVAAAGFACELAIGKVLGTNGGYDSWIAAGMNWAWQTAGAKVINMSLGRSGASTTLDTAVDAAWNNGVVVVAAAGNSATSAIFYPAASPNCIAVAAVDDQGALASFSNFGAWVDIAGPGVNVVSTYKGSAYASLSGTSMASPHVAGAAALVWATSWGTSATSVRSRLTGTSARAVTGTNAGALRVLDAGAAVAP